MYYTIAGRPSVYLKYVIVQEFLAQGPFSSTLTFRTVVSFPALQTDAVALLIAGVVAQRVVPRPAVFSAAVSKVVLVTEDMVGVAQLALLAEVHVL